MAWCGLGASAPDKFTQLHHPNWRQYGSIKVYIEDLPSNVRTLDIHRAVKELGQVVKIEITKSLRNPLYIASVEFRPPPSKPFWAQRGTKIKFENGTTGTHRVKLAKSQKDRNHLTSLNRPNVVYDEEICLDLTSVEFGVLGAKDRMISMISKPAQGSFQPQLTLKLRRKEIEVKFPSYLRSDQGGVTRLYQFNIATDEKFDAWATTNANETYFVVHVGHPPLFSRQLTQRVMNSHGSNMSVWREDDLWTRQTDIVDHKDHYKALDDAPVSVRKNLNSINIARWAAYKLNIKTSANQSEKIRTFFEALKDFNINVEHNSGFSVVRRPEPNTITVWEDMDRPTTGNAMHDLSAEDLTLSKDVRYQLEVCISRGWLSEYDIDVEFMRKLKGLGVKATRNLLHLDASQTRLFDPLDLFTDIHFQKPIRPFKISDGFVEVRHATVTATSVKFFSPTIEVSNRILRRYRHHSDRFLRVSFEDDEYRGKSRIYPTTNNRMDLLFRRVQRVLRNGIKVGDLLYEFLAWGNSQLRDHGTYFFASVTGGLTASNIRAQMGVFDNETVIAKRAARMGQCFSTTNAIHLKIPPVTMDNVIPDIERNGYTFTDGVGKISEFAARIVHNQLKIKGPIPSVYQFRLGGCKGILVVDPTLVDRGIQIRKSQFKFVSPSGELEIIRHSEFWQACTNRQLILVLSYLGVPAQVFLKKQQVVIDAINNAMKDDIAALRALRNNIDPNMMTLNIATLVTAQFRKTEEPFVVALLQLWRAWTLKYLKEKSKIPLAKGALVLGCVDETATLCGHFDKPTAREGATKQQHDLANLPEIFIQTSNPETDECSVIEGICAIARNPSLHPGDIRVVRAVNNPRLHHLSNVVVLPQTGDRDLSSMCSGGDLDGDDYIVIWDEDLIPPIWNVKPFHYEAPPPKVAASVITTDNIIDFFLDYMQNDFLGRIATAHLARADQTDEEPGHGLESRECLELVQLHSLAVDFPKTGVPAVLTRQLEPAKYPHFMQKRNSYKSTGVLGQLFDNVQKTVFKPDWNDRFDRRILDYDKPTSEMLAIVSDLKADYDAALQRIMSQHRIDTEFEVWSTFVLGHSKASRDFKFHEEIGQLSKSLKEHYRAAIIALAGGDDFHFLAPWAVAAYHFTRDQVQCALEEVEEGKRELKSQSMPFISFPWLLQETIIRIVSLVTECEPEMVTDSIIDHQNKDMFDLGQEGTMEKLTAKLKATKDKSSSSELLFHKPATDFELVDERANKNSSASTTVTEEYSTKDTTDNEAASMEHSDTDQYQQDLRYASLTEKGFEGDPASMTEEQLQATNFYDDML